MVEQWRPVKGYEGKYVVSNLGNVMSLIRECVEKHIREYPFHELERDEIGSVIWDVIMERILTPQKEAVKDEAETN